MIAETISHYRIVDELGRGGMGVVYRAEDTKLGRPVALKFLPVGVTLDGAARERFLREARAAAALNHPNICTIYEVDDGGEQPFLAMELLEGETLAARLSREPLSVDRVLEIGSAIADALSAAHHRGLVHRDVKPANVFLTADGRTKVLDFGLAKALPEAPADGDTRLADLAITAPGSTLGTVAYMSPEQARGDAVDARTDIFSLGVVLYEMATGARPFPGETAAVVFDGILNRAPQPPSTLNRTVPPELDAIIAAALEKDPVQRYRSAADVGSNLRQLRLARESGRLSTAGSIGPTGRSGVLSRKVLWRIAASAGVALAALVAVLLWSSGRTEALAETDVIVLTDFVNSTGDDVFDGTLREALAIKLEESPFLNVASTQRIRETLRFMNRSPDDPITPEVGRDVCQRLGLKALMTGGIARLGSAYVITLGAENCATGDRLASEQVQAPEKERVLAVLDQAVSSLRGKLGESLASIQELDTPIEQATTASLEALKAFSLGDARRAVGGDRDSIPFYQRALELDPDFALAHARLGTVYDNLTEYDRAIEHRRRAFALRDRVSERERLYITAHYYASVSRELDKAQATYELWRRTYPRDTTPVNNLGILYQTLGEPERALATYREGIELDASQRLLYRNAFKVGVLLGRLDDARQVLDRYESTFGQDGFAHLSRFELAFANGDRQAMDRHAAAVAGTEVETELLSRRAAVEFMRGRFGAARELKRREVDRWSRQGLGGRAAVELAGWGLAEATLGYTERARETLEEALSMSAGPGASFMAAFGFARLDDPDRADATLEAAGRLPMDPVSRAMFLGTLQAEIAMRRGRYDAALDLLRGALPYELGHDGGFNAIFIRGEVLLRSRRGADAAMEFRKILERPDRSPLDAAHRLAPLGLARALVLSGDTDGARQAYEQFFDGWSDADPDVPLIEQARREYEALSQGRPAAGPSTVRSRSPGNDRAQGRRLAVTEGSRLMVSSPT